MKRIDAQCTEDRNIARTVIMLVTKAQIPLTVAEVQCALSVRSGDKEFDEEGIPDAEDMISPCAGLITVDHETRVVRLVRELHVHQKTVISKC
jgi:hypothetical protein